MYYTNLLLFSLLAFNFGSFIWAAFRFFRWQADQTIPNGAKNLARLVLPAKAALLFALWLEPFSLGFSAFVSIWLLLFSAVLFWWSLATNRRHPLTAAYSNDLPVHLVQHGPYRYVRHPFYTSYLLSYLGGFVMLPCWWTALAVIVPFMVYLQASAFEEKKFSQSSLSNAYQLYRQQTGRFWPKLFIGFN